jgi:hypothetical protein
MSSLTMLPKAKQSRTSLDITPLNARVMLASTPKCGKTTLASEWAPDTTLIIDTQHGTDLLPGEHYVQHVTDWTAFASTVDKLCEPGHTFKTVVIDMVDDVWRFVDRYYAGPNKEGNLTRYVPKLDGKVLTYVNGVVQFVFLAETLGPKRVLHTQPSAKFEAGSRVPLPEPMEMDARQLYAAMARGLRPPKTETNEENAA